MLTGICEWLALRKPEFSNSCRKKAARVLKQKTSADSGQNGSTKKTTPFPDKTQTCAARAGSFRDSAVASGMLGTSAQKLLYGSAVAHKLLSGVEGQLVDTIRVGSRPLNVDQIIVAFEQQKLSTPHLSLGGRTKHVASSMKLAGPRKQKTIDMCFQIHSLPH